MRVCPSLRPICLGALLALAVPRARAACEQPISGEQLDSTLAVAEQSAGRDGERFGKAAEALQQQLSCLVGPATPEQAAHLHRLLGLQAFVQGRRDRTIQAFAAAQRVDPTYVLPPERFPQAHPITQLYRQAMDQPWETVPVKPPLGAETWFDGVRSPERPQGVPTVMQLVAFDGTTLVSSYLWPEEPLPGIPAGLLNPPPPTTSSYTPRLEVQTPGSGGPHLPLAVSAGISAMAAAGSYGLALATASDYRNNPHDNAELEALRSRANALVYVSGGLGTVALGTGLGAALSWPRQP